MALIQCPSCGQMISEQAPMCPHCGHPIANVNYYNSPQPQPQPQPQPKSGNNSKVIVGILAAIIATLGIILLVVMSKGCAKGNSDIVSSSSSSETTSFGTSESDIAASDTTATTDIMTAVDDAAEKTSVQEDEYEEPESEYITPDDEFIVASYKGNGLFLRYAPRSGATTKITYPDDTHFLGAYSDTPGWVMVIENGKCIGYFPQNKLIVAGDYETERYYNLN